MGKRFGIVLAAGKGTRMRSKKYKVLHKVCGKEMVAHVVDRAKELSLDRLLTVVGCGAEAVREVLGARTEYVLQEEQLGTAHAVWQAHDALAALDGTTLILYGDTPLLRKETLQNLLEWHEESGAAVTVLTAHMEDPTGYGRILRDEEGHIRGIVEDRDANEEELQIKEVNTGIYCFDNRLLFQTLPLVDHQNAQQEYYLPDVVDLLRRQHMGIQTANPASEEEILGINDRVALARAEKIMQRRINRIHQLSGVTIVDPEQTYIGAEVRIGQDTVLYPGTVLSGKTTIGSDCEIGPNAELTDMMVEDGVKVTHSVLIGSTVKQHSTVGPFAYVRPQCVIGPETKVGDFVELKNTYLGKGSKVSHLTYLGDADIGEDVNVGCGAVTVNYDGFQKFRTTVEDRAFIGCNVNLIAPVTVGKGAYIAAGSTITDSVPANSLAVARERQTNKEGYAERLRAKRG